MRQELPVRRSKKTNEELDPESVGEIVALLVGKGFRRGIMGPVKFQELEAHKAVEFK